MEGRLDLRLFAPEVVVEPGDNLRAPYARVEILKGCYRLELSRPGLGDVLIRQKEGFSAPWVRIEAPNLGARRSASAPTSPWSGLSGKPSV